MPSSSQGVRDHVAGNIKKRRLFFSTFPPCPPWRSAFIKEIIAAMASFSAPFTATVHLTF